MCLCIAFGILLGTLGALRVRSETVPLKTLADTGTVSSIRGTLIADPVPWGESLYRVSLRVTSCRDTDKSQFEARGLCRLLIPASLVRSALPGGVTGRKGKDVIFASGLELELSGKMKTYEPASGEIFLVSSVCSGSGQWSTPGHRFRARLRLFLMRLLYDWKEAGGFLLALLSANRDYLDPALASDFRNAGLAHVLALSGMHLSLIGLLAIETGKRIGGRRFSLRLSLAAILFFVWFAGASPSLSRSLVMAVLLLSERALGFKPRMLPTLASAAVLQMLASPADALTLAFMLSYGALWGILTFGEYLSNILRGLIPTVAISPISASVGAQLMTTPIVAVSIGTLSPIGILASCIVSPLASVFLAAGIVLVFIAAVFPPLSPVCSAVLDFLYRCVSFPVRQFAFFPPLSIMSVNGTIGACIIPLIAGLSLMRGSAVSSGRRSPDAGFARL